MIRLTGEAITDKEERQILDFRRFELKDKPLIDAYFSEHHYEASDCCFTTLFMWQDTYGISWAEDDGVLYIRGGGKRTPFLLPPFAGKDGKFVDGLEKAKQWFKENNLEFLLKGVNPIIMERMKKLCPDCYVFTPDRDNFEYIYLTQDLMTLAGKKFRQKKNHLNQFRMQYTNYEYMAITEDVIPLCRETATSWTEGREEEDGVMDELRSINLLFDHWEPLKLRGGAIKLFGRVEAFAIGELLNEHMALVHIEKANQNIRGLYQAINYEFVRHAFYNTTYVNREEDMGIPGLRKAKESYNLVRFAEKYDARCIKGSHCSEG